MLFIPIHPTHQHTIIISIDPADLRKTTGKQSPEEQSTGVSRVKMPSDPGDIPLNCQYKCQMKPVLMDNLPVKSFLSQ